MPPQLSNGATNSKIHGGNLEIFQPELHTYHAVWLLFSISLRLLVDTSEMALDITPHMDTRPPHLSNDTTNSKIHCGNLEIFQLKLHTYAILLFCSISLWLLVDRFEMTLDITPHMDTSLPYLSNDTMIPQFKKSTVGIWRYFKLNSTHIMRFCYFSQIRCSS